MTLETAVQDEVMISAMRAELYQGIYDMLDREALRSKDNGDQVYAEYAELIRAKVRALEHKK